MPTKFIVEMYRRLGYKGRRVFRTRDAAVQFVNDWQDNGHYADEGWLAQMIRPDGRIEQFGVNGNNR